jgi:hypothetical protein
METSRLLNTRIAVPPASFAPASTLYVGRYGNGRTALLLGVDGQVEVKATVNVPELEDLPRDHVLLKGWSENEGVPEALVAAGAVELTGDTVATGRVAAQMARLTELTKERIAAAFRAST